MKTIFIKKRFFALVFPTLFTSVCFGQQFTKITDTNNPIVTDSPTSGYTGASWIDFDNDGDLDLFVNQQFLYRNDGDDHFTKLPGTGIGGGGGNINNGNTWGDFDNDGWIDLYVANQSSALYKNNGDETFTKVTSGGVSSNVNGWAASMADFDNDGWLDIAVTHPCGFIGSCHPNWLFQSDGNGGFTSVSGSNVTTGNAAYTVGNWSDFDDDGDMDFFIGSGEVSAPSLDHIYINQLTETGMPNLVRNNSGTLFGEQRDGQNWNWIDFDNDGDLDGFVTNYLNAKPNDFYKNMGDGTFQKLSQTELGADMVSATGLWLTNLWGDFDNDGDLDAFVGNDATADRYYRNNGNGTFTNVNQAFSIGAPTRGASAGDYDNDGDLDIFISAPNVNTKGLYKNETANGNNWAIFTLEGTTSNRSAVGAKIRAKAIIGGQEVWQLREISTQSSFCGTNSLRVHFGLKDATQIDSLIIEWPLGETEVYTGIPTNQICGFTENGGTDCMLVTAVVNPDNPNITFKLFPNPVVSDEATLQYRLEGAADARVEVFGFDGKRVEVSPKTTNGLAENELLFDFSNLQSGIYLIKLQAGNIILTKKFILRR